MLLTLLIAAALTSETNYVPGFAQFRVSRSLLGTMETVDISAYRDKRLNRLEYKVRYHWNQDRNPKQIEAVVNSIDCPTIRQIVTTLGEISMPQPLPVFDLDIPPPPTMDGWYYELKARSSFVDGSISITSREGTPLATWVEHALVALQPCLPPTPFS